MCVIFFYFWIYMKYNSVVLKNTVPRVKLLKCKHFCTYVLDEFFSGSPKGGTAPLDLIFEDFVNFLEK